MSFREERIIYFSKREHGSLKKTLRIAKEKAEELGIKSIVVATDSGDTGVEASEIFRGYNLVVVTAHYGWSKPNSIELTEKNRKKIMTNGGKILSTTHALGGVGRAVRRKFKTIQADEIVANTIRIFGEGMKVAIEIALMAADAGLIRTDEDVISVGKWDSAIIARPTNVRDFFDFKVNEILCKPIFRL